MLIVQGLDDKVVPPAQAEQIVAALRAQRRAARLPAARGRGARVPPARVARSARSRSRSSFYGQVFGFEPADDVERVEIVGL